jgi:hypothetical protein
MLKGTMKIQSLPKFREQYERLLRYYRRYGRISMGIKFDGPQEDLLDDIYAFFLNCYILKDWLKNDKSFKKRDIVESYVQSNHTLMLCADICNGIKHLELLHSRSGAIPKLVGNYCYDYDFWTQSDPSDRRAEISVKVEIEVEGEMVCGYKLATDAVNAWKEFIE